MFVTMNRGCLKKVSFITLFFFKFLRFEFWVFKYIFLGFSKIQIRNNKHHDKKNSSFISIGKWKICEYLSEIISLLIKEN